MKQQNKPQACAFSPDGKLLAVAGGGYTHDHGVRIWDTATGELSQLPGKAGCIAGRPPIADCARSRRLSDPSSIALSRDGRHAYVTWSETDAVGVYRRAR